MYHISSVGELYSRISSFLPKKMPPRGGIFLNELLRLLLALLISDAAAGLASRLAGGLALAASAVLCAIAKVLGFNSLDMSHFGILRYLITLKL
jgi:hypothetical protein